MIPKQNITASNTNADYERIRAIMHEKPDGYNKFYVLRQLNEKPGLRRVYLALVKNSPARIYEIFEDAVLTKPTCYANLYKLLEMHLVSRVFAMDVMNGKVVNPEIKKKFEEWITHMPEPLKRYYLAKTSFWVISDFGKGFAGKAWVFEQEFRESEDKRV